MGIVSWISWYPFSIMLETGPTNHWDRLVNLWYTLYNSFLCHFNNGFKIYRYVPPAMFLPSSYYCLILQWADISVPYHTCRCLFSFWIFRCPFNSITIVARNLCYHTLIILENALFHHCFLFSPKCTESFHSTQGKSVSWCYMIFFIYTGAIG